MTNNMTSWAFEIRLTAEKKNKNIIISKILNFFNSNFKTCIMATKIDNLKLK